MFTAYQSLDKCIGKEVLVRMGAQESQGILAGLYTLHGVPLLVLVQGSGAGTREQHIPLAQAVVTVSGA
jgi:hypothetical protein